MKSLAEQILENGYCKDFNGKTVKIHSAITLQEGKFLQEIISDIKPTVSIEIGLAYGISTLFICDAIKNIKNNSQLIVIDAHQLIGWNGIGLYNLQKAGYEKLIKFYESLSYQILPQLEIQGIKIDFAFIDGWHTFDYAMIDFFYIDKMLRLGGIVVFHDFSLYPSVEKLCRYIVTNLPYKPVCMFSPDNSRISIKRRILNLLLRIPRISEKMKRVLKPEILQTNFTLGLCGVGSCVALKKESDDSRRWDYHNYF